jgi:hypothetical protein
MSLAVAAALRFLVQIDLKRCKRFRLPVGSDCAAGKSVLRAIRLYDKEYSMKRNTPVAAAQAVLILPSLLFMGALAVRYLHVAPFGLSETAQQIVMWYAARMWTLWIFLLALPLAVLAAGCFTLLLSGKSGGTEEKSRLPAMAVTAETLMSAGILAIVVLHMLAN